MPPTLTLYSSNRCPYAHRTRLTLTEKGLAFNRVEIDLDHKPANFNEISPYGKVPVLLVEEGGDRLRLWESMIINEYLEEAFPEPALLPRSAGGRAVARIWIDFINNQFTPAFYKLLLAQDAARQDQWRQTLHDHCRFLETEVLNHGGDYLLATGFSLVDIALYPWFERWETLSHYRGFPLPADCPRLQTWLAKMNGRGTVQAWRNDPQQYLDDYRAYANNTATTTTAQALRSD
ncbi:MAG: glutathione S-transferase family protein [Spirulina sp. DLM2.Bin59]|nr:MAG: glutathione S-transferase family protein [Spirulina sp. DLM2.Bin59]